MDNRYKEAFLFLFLLLIHPLSSQNFSGRVTNHKSEPIAGSTVFIVEANQGIACNLQGAFQTTLKEGVYNVEYRCLGHESFSETIQIKPNEKLYRSIVLTEKPIELKEVVVTNNKEDRAYSIMRKAIEKAPYHQRLVNAYEADCYIKGDLELVSVSKIVDKLSSVDGMKMSDFKGNLFIQESYSTIKFRSPDSYEQTVKAFSSSAPDDFDPKDAMRFIISSLYLPRFSGLISPLNPQAFTFYRFRYEGYLEEDGEYINKIKVIPKMKDPELLEGDLYIADNSWDIRYADLTGNMYGIKQQFTITYDLLSDKVYLPTTYSNKLHGKLMGVEGYFNYYASIKYNEIIVNESAESIEKEIKEAKKPKSLEIKMYDKNYLVKTDSLSTQRDSLFWAEIRNTPLNDREKQSYVVKDSIQGRVDSVRKTYTNATFEPFDLVTGGRIGGDSTRFEFKYGGIIGALKDYSFVDGFSLGQKFELSAKLNQSNKLVFTPELYYTTARKNLVWSATLELKYAPMRLGHLIVSAGDVSADFSPSGTALPDDAFSTLFYGENHRMLYRNKYFHLRNAIDLTNGLQLITILKAADRSALTNNTRYRFFGSGSKIKENLQDMEYNDLLSYSVGFTYTPEYYYSIYEGRKRYRHTKYPTITMFYDEGFSSVSSENSRFRRLQGQINHRVRLNPFSSFSYLINAGGYLGDRSRMNFADYKHINTTGNVWAATKSPLYSFMLLDPYQASTNKYWVYSHINYNSKYILFKRLPFLQGKLFNEGLHLKYLYTPTMKNYTELGYSVDLFHMLSLGVHCSFLKFNYESVGLRMVFNMDVFR